MDYCSCKEPNIVGTGDGLYIDSLYCIECKKTYQPKPECDHIVEITSGGWEEPYIDLMNASGKRLGIECEPEHRYFPKHCPECGEAIEKQLNSTK